LFDELDIVGADVEVLVDDVVADLFGVEEEDPDLVLVGNSEAVATVTARCGYFPPLLRLSDRSRE
jgi:hypothetical protein